MPEDKSAAAERCSVATATVPEVVNGEQEDGAVARRCGRCAAMCEAFVLLVRYPDFTRVIFACAILFGCAVMPWVVCLPELQTQVWGAEAGAYNSYLTAARSAIGALACPVFGRLTDRRGHKFGVIVVIITNIILTNGALAVFGLNMTGLVVFFVFQTINSAAGMNTFGCPAVFALISDVLPAEYREIGFSLFFVAMNTANFSFIQVGSLLIRLFPDFPTLAVWLTLVLSLVSLALLAPVQSGGPQEADEEEKDRSILNWLEPLCVAWQNPTLLCLCIIAVPLSFVDMAGVGIGTQYLYNQLGVVGASTQRLQSATLLFRSYPMIVMAAVYGLVGVLCRRFGAISILKSWLPFCALCFAAPAMLTVYTDDWAILVAGTGSTMAFSCEIPLQSLVIHVVPANRVGEAMGALASGKMISSIFAPIICGFAWTAIEKSGSDLYWAIWCVAALLMFVGFPFIFLLEQRVSRDKSARWSAWASAKHSIPSALLSKQQHTGLPSEP